MCETKNKLFLNQNFTVTTRQVRRYSVIPHAVSLEKANVSQKKLLALLIANLAHNTLLLTLAVLSQISPQLVLFCKDRPLGGL